MIELNLRVSDPTRSDAPRLLALAALFTQLAQGSNAEQVRAELDNKTAGRVVGASPALAAPYAGGATLDPADNPAAGMPSPAEAFGMGNGAAVQTADSVTAPACSTATQISAPVVAALPDPAAAFGGAGNVPPVPAPVAGNPAISAPQTGSLPPVQPSAPSAAGAHAGVELDAEGIPWDASIHASTKAKIANGTWKVKRGTGEAYLIERKALLKAAVSAGGNAAPAGVPVTPPASVLVPPPAGAPAPVSPPPPSNPGNAQAPAAGATPTPTALPQTTPGTAGSSGVVTMAQVLPRVTSAISGGLLTPDSAAAIVLELSEGKINNVAMLAVAPQLLAPFAARLDLLGIPQ